ncbi:D-isomer specific 2-hydroxyacid dehydrogenase [Enterococcus haemoperoxidus ATCC BAA-382]|uniref:D-isomer specific 2-hydroxyacid dehydrogenase n=1 Tax=Enterococcus haemoperoxidus ATCC BAA-382 TaxID=1158608 RepID=R2T569_9ENTE|nr:phosphoglycerate dehydrogenase [Enterococcus haemoperoxidus]EOI00164.1 D-isomer specific 2-hydroxyacid dehydrogenase [Enterococcus haemoperoxidus ATCC BAA-382]EOT59598.1 D-isomer specific 2-hydroxyacid dehydrogenase [Enterococcus haemoperoxidus ATCC BAA-382]OJG52435.1 D-isomer specific 2-hydroxyacid dehydrogenase [Enterococcus haemoperoxidus]
MGQPLIYLYEQMKEEQVETIRQTAPDYIIIDAKRESPELIEDDIEIMLGWDKELGQRLLDSDTSRLAWVQSISAGVDTYDLERFAEKGILLSNASGIHSISISEHVLGVLLAEFRGIRTSIINQANKQWTRDNVSYRQLSMQKMLIVGTGHIGQQLAVFAQGLGIQTYGVNTSGHVTNGFIECYSHKNMSRIVKEMDIVVNILPLTDDTYQMYNERMFLAMKPGTVFINVGRGPSINTNDLVQALNTGQLSFAALDVFEEEPLPENSPLWSMENVLITPHISGLTPQFKEKLLNIFIPNLRQFLKDKSLAKNEIALHQGY